MPPATNPITEEIGGIVVRVSQNGFTLAGRDGWLNVSKYAEPPPPMPPEGARVRVGLDRAGFVRTVDVEELPAESTPVPATRDRDTRIMRQAVLNTATAILASGGKPVSVDEVLDLAERLEAWVMRED